MAVALRRRSGPSSLSFSSTFISQAGLLSPGPCILGVTSLCATATSPSTAPGSSASRCCTWITFSWMLIDWLCPVL
jgi:hypothetical protein